MIPNGRNGVHTKNCINSLEATLPPPTPIVVFAALGCFSGVYWIALTHCFECTPSARPSCDVVSPCVVFVQSSKHPLRCRAVQFVKFAVAFLADLSAAGHWGDYIDPCSGMPVRFGGCSAGAERTRSCPSVGPGSCFFLCSLAISRGQSGIVCGCMLLGVHACGLPSASVLLARVGPSHSQHTYCRRDCRAVVLCCVSLTRPLLAVARRCFPRWTASRRC